MPKGGYRLLDLKGADLKVGVDINIPGIYEFIEGTKGKPIMVSNLANFGREEKPFYTCFRDISGTYVGLWAIASTIITCLFVTPDDNLVARNTNIGGQAGDEPVSGEDGPSASM